MQGMKLYEFPISHFCEIVRWALDLKGLPYTSVPLIPGFHQFTTRRLGPKSFVPLLIDGRRIVQGSNFILDHLEQSYPNRYSLECRDPIELAASRDLEKKMSVALGETLRRVFYSHLLQHRDVLLALVAGHGKPWEQTVMKFAFPVLSRLMRQSMNIYPEPTAKALKDLKGMMDLVHRRLAGRMYLFEDRLTRADVMAASLLSPLVMPPEHPYGLSVELPLDLQMTMDDLLQSPLCDWVRQIYAAHRKKTSSNQGKVA